MPTKLSGYPNSFPLPLMASSAIQECDLGAQAADGARKFRYVKAGGTAIVPGKLQQSPAAVDNHKNLACAAAAIGATQVTVTLGATAATANQYAEGYLIINDATGEGYTYKIKSHPAAALSTALVVTLEDPIVLALDTNSEASLVANPYNGVIVNPTTGSAAPIGMGIYPIPAGEYGWVQTFGVVSGLADGALAAGAQLSASNAVAGAVESEVAGQANIGRAIVAGVDTEYRAIFIDLD